MSLLSSYINFHSLVYISALAAQRIPACSFSDFNYQKRQSLPLCSPLLLSQPPSSSTWLLLSPSISLSPSLISDFVLSQSVLFLSCFHPVPLMCCSSCQMCFFIYIYIYIQGSFLNQFTHLKVYHHLPSPPPPTSSLPPSTCCFIGHILCHQMWNPP